MTSVQGVQAAAPASARLLNHRFPWKMQLLDDPYCEGDPSLVGPNSQSGDHEVGQFGAFWTVEDLHQRGCRVLRTESTVLTALKHQVKLAAYVSWSAVDAKTRAGEAGAGYAQARLG